MNKTHKLERRISGESKSVNRDGSHSSRRKTDVLTETLEKGIVLIKSHQRTDGSWRGEVSADTQNTVCAIFVLLEAGFKTSNPAVRDGIRWLLKNQNDDGGWGECKECPSTADFTTLALLALEKAQLRQTKAYESGLHYRTKANYETTYVVELADRSREALLTFLGGKNPQKSKIRLPFVGTCVSIRNLLYCPDILMRAAAFLQLINYGLALNYKLLVLPRRCAQNSSRKQTRGVLSVKSMQKENGSWDDTTYYTTLSVLSLLRSGVSKEDVAIRKSVNWILQNKSLDGGWIFAPAVGTDTLFTLKALHEAGEDIQSAVVQRTLRFLKEIQNEDGGWPTNPYVGSDVDDAALGLMNLLHFGEDIHSRHVRRGKEYLKRMQKRDGSWPTWHKKETGCIDTTVHAMMALTMVVQSQADLSAIKKGEQWLLGQQSRDGFWVPRWFISLPYGTSHAILALTESENPECQKAIRKSLNWIRKAQNVDGGWGHGPGSRSNPEDTAHALLGLIEGGDDHNSSFCQSAAEWLISHQLSDGSWETFRGGRTQDTTYTYSDSMYTLSFVVWSLGRYLRSLKSEESASNSEYEKHKELA